MGKMNDDEIINEVSSWEKAQRAERAAQRRDLWSVLRWCALGLVGAAGIVAISQIAPRCAASVQVERVQRETENAQRHVQQENAWAACLKALGLAQCDAIEARLAERCLVPTTDVNSAAANSTADCLRAEISQ
jgi:hypothetical protein